MRFIPLLIILALLIGYQMTSAPKLPKTIPDELAEQAPMTAAELDHFIAVLPDYLAWKEAHRAEIPQQDWNTDAGPAIIFSDALISWLAEKDFTVDRFFLLERQVDNALMALRFTGEKEKTRKLLLLQRKNILRNLPLNAPQPSTVTQLDRLIAETKKETVLRGLSEKEVLLVKDKRDILEQILGFTSAPMETQE